MPFGRMGAIIGWGIHGSRRKLKKGFQNGCSCEHEDEGIPKAESKGNVQMGAIIGASMAAEANWRISEWLLLHKCS